jgi:hypothetical protein
MNKYLTKSDIDSLVAKECYRVYNRYPGKDFSLGRTSIAQLNDKVYLFHYDREEMSTIELYTNVKDFSTNWANDNCVVLFNDNTVLLPNRKEPMFVDGAVSVGIDKNHAIVATRNSIVHYFVDTNRVQEIGYHGDIQSAIIKDDHVIMVMDYELYIGGTRYSDMAKMSVNGIKYIKLQKNCIALTTTGFTVHNTHYFAGNTPDKVVFTIIDDVEGYSVLYKGDIFWVSTVKDNEYKILHFPHGSIRDIVNVYGNIYAYDDGVTLLSLGEGELQ